MPFVPDPQPTPQPGRFVPDLDSTIDVQTQKQGAPPAFHTEQALSSLAMPRDPRMPKDVSLPRAGRNLKSMARGAVKAYEAGTLDRNPKTQERETQSVVQNLGLDQPDPTSGDRGFEFLGGFLSPSPGGVGPKGASLSAARAADKAGPTLGQKTGSQALQVLEKSLARLPGGGAIVRSIQSQNEKLGQTTDDVIQSLSGGADTSAEGAGGVLKSQIKKAAQRMKQEAASHYDEVEKLIPKDTPIGVKNTLETVKRLTTPLEGAENVSQKLINKDIQAIREALEKDLEGNHLQAMPYQTLKSLRTRVGELVDWGVFSSDPKNGQLKQLYNALTADMNVGASAVSPEAAAAVKKANEAYAKSKEAQQVLKSVINKAGGPEKVFDSLMNGTRQGASTLRQVLASVDEPSKQILAASALQRMGRATPGAQGAAGTAFSADTFLTNWNRMSAEAREALFGTLPGNYAQSVSRLAANVEGLKAYAKLLPNHSNTAQAMIFSGEAGAAIMALMHGDTKVAAGLAGSAAGTMALAQALTNPETTAWLANRTGQILVQASKAEAGGSRD